MGTDDPSGLSFRARANKRRLNPDEAGHLLMLSHDRIWTLIDRLAARNGLSVSGLAKKAGLDPTTFNKSKRVAGDGRLRWPSTESLAKILQATNTNVVDFYLGLDLELKGTNARRLERTDWFAMAPERQAGFFEDAPDRSKGTGAEDEPGNGDPIWFPLEPERSVYAVAVPPSAIGPLCRADATLIVSPDAAISPGDRVLVLGTDGVARVLQVSSLSEDAAELADLDGSGERTVPLTGSVFMARVLWVSQ